MLALKFRSWLLLQLTLKRRRMSNAAGPQSSVMLPVAGVANAPSVSFTLCPKDAFVKSCIRRQLHRGGSGAFVALGAAVALATTDDTIFASASAPETMPGPPAEVTLKLTLAPMFSVCCRD